MALDAAWTYSEHHQRALMWEIRQVEKVLHNLDCFKILLKGASYIYQEMEFAQGRLVSDLDVLVPKTAIQQAYSQLLNFEYALLYAAKALLLRGGGCGICVRADDHVL